MRRPETPIRNGACSLLAALLLSAGCAGAGGPPPIVVGTPCAACGMDVRDLRFACERDAASPAGTARARPPRTARAWRVFDSIECLLRDAASGTPGAGAPGMARAWLADYDRRTLHAADSMWVVQGEFASPMGGGFAAFLDQAAADSVAAVTRGRVDRLVSFLAAQAESVR